MLAQQNLKNRTVKFKTSQVIINLLYENGINEI